MGNFRNLWENNMQRLRSRVFLKMQGVKLCNDRNDVLQKFKQ